MDQGRGMRGDVFRPGWRSLVGAVVLAVLLLHGFDASFTVDGYTLSMLALLVLLALAGELELARIGGFEFKFREALLSRAEHDLNEAAMRRAEMDRAGEDEGADEDEPPEVQDFSAPPLSEPGEAVVAFFSEMEQAVERLFRPLAREGDDDASLERKVDVLTEWKVITPAEARVVLDLASLRSAYVHGRGVRGEEAARLVAVGARLLTSLSEARRRIGRAFEEQVEEVLESLFGVSFERPSFDPREAGWIPQPDFLVTSPVKIVVEAKAMTEAGSFIKRESQVKSLAARWADYPMVVVVPWVSRDFGKRFEDRTGVPFVPLDRLAGWLKDRIDQ
jgi:hypothetical protein